MTTPVLPLHTPPVLAAWRNLASAFAGLRAALARTHAARRTRRALAALDDHLLRDLGLDRSEIESVATHPRLDRIRR